MKIGILSDTHKKLGRAIVVIDLFKQNGCEFIIHSGDIVREEVLEYLEEIKIPYIAVLGNNDKHLLRCQDKYNIVQEPYCFSKNDTRFKLMHRPYYLAVEKSDIIIYGHTHTQIYEKIGNALFLNSGEVCARDKGYSQCMILDIKEQTYEISLYNRKIKTKQWKMTQNIINK